MKQKGPFAHRAFFAAAAVQGAAGIAVWVLVPGAAYSPVWHAHEMVFGYALAVVAGFLLTKSSGREVAVALAVWVAARLAWSVPGAPELVRAALTLASTGTIAALASRGFLHGVKRGWNAVFPALLSALVLGDLVVQFGVLVPETGVARPALLVAVMLVVLLVVVMGGRITGAALSGLAQRAGGPRIPPTPGLERVLVAAVGGVALALALGAPILLAISAWTGAGALALRLAGWRSGFRHAGSDLQALAVAQLFIAVGLAGLGAGWLAPPWPESAPMHLLTVGGIGIATVTMMLKTHAQRERCPPREWATAAAAVLLSVAAVMRALGHAAPDIAYPMAGLAWTAAMAVCLAGLLRRR